MMQEVGVIVEGFLTHKDEHVSSEVSKKEANEDEASNGHDRLFSNRRIPEGADRLRECGHESAV